MEIKNEKELTKLLHSKISVPIYYTEDPDNAGTIKEGVITIDEESMREEFELKLQELITAINNY